MLLKIIETVKELTNLYVYTIDLYKYIFVLRFFFRIEK